MGYSMQESSFFERNKVVSFSIIIACMLFIGIFFMEKSKSVINMIPILRGEVSLGNNFVITTTRNGYPILIKKDDPTVGNQLRFSGDVRSIFDDIVFSLCEKGGVIIEVGAHFGYRSIHFGKFLDGNGKIYAFEPNFGVFSNLRKTIFLNELDNTVVLKNIAISDYKGTCNIDDCLSIKKLHDGTFSKPRNITVNCSTLDDEMATEMRPIKLLSIDIPGSEFSIIKGAWNIINRSPDIIMVVSFDNDPINKNAEQELKQLEQNNFNFYVSGKGSTLKEITLQELLKPQETILVITKKTLKCS